jgi:superfamily II DNA or RNA helicase
MKKIEIPSSLSKMQLDVLTALSAVFEPLGAAEWLTLLQELDIKDDQNKTFNNSKFSIVKDNLMKLGFLREVTANFSRYYAIGNNELADTLLIKTVEEDTLSYYLKATQIQMPWNGSWAGNSNPFSLSRCLRDMRFALLQADYNGMKISLARAMVMPNAAEEVAKLYNRIFGHPEFQADFLKKFPKEFQVEIIAGLVGDAFENCLPMSELEWSIEKEFLQSNSELSGSLALLKIAKGDLVAAEKLLQKTVNSEQVCTLALLFLLKGEYEKSAATYEIGIQTWRKETGKRKGFPTSKAFAFYPFPFIRNRNPNNFPQILEYTKILTQRGERSLVAYYDGAISFLQNNSNAAESTLRSYAPQNQLEAVIRTAICSWVNPDMLVWKFVKIELDRAENNGHQWFALEFCKYLSLGESVESGYFIKAVDRITKASSITSLCDLLPKTENWERAIELLSVLSLNSNNENKKQVEVGASRLAWLIDFEENGIQPVEQKLGKNNAWTVGRNVALKRLKTEGIPNMTDQDKDIVAKSLKVERYAGGWGNYGSEEYVFDPAELWKRLAGHPLLFLFKNPAVSIQLLKDEPQITIQEKGENIIMQFNVPVKTPGTQIIKETNTRYKVLEITAKHLQVAQAMGGEQLKIPKQGRASLNKAIENLSSLVTVHSDLNEHTENLPKVEADPHIYAVLVPLGESFQLEFYVKPFGASNPPYLRPAKGSEMVYADVNGIRSQTRRNLQAERDMLHRVETDCPTLGESEDDSFEWDLVGAERCLQVLLEMEKPREEGILIVEWPKGERLRIAGTAGFDNLKMGIQRDSDWFGLDGKVQVGEDIILNMQQLLKIMDTSKGNFVEISDGQYIALTDQFKKQLDGLKSVLDEKGRFHPLAAGLVEDFAALAGEVKVDNHWKQHLVRLKDAQSYTAELPSTFQAELRSYQMEGFQWMSQLAHWGVGACLADDMGLGKTVQALAVLVDRAKNGPAMVIAPVSVCRNWEREASKFAPTLNVHLLGMGDRKEMVEAMGKFDLLIVSYGLLQGESDLLESKNFHTIVIDEAQAIKNRATKRSKAAMSLNADFKIITTGTPIENHLGELWNLFNFINPGLLGSLERFNERYAVPIEKFRDDDKRHQLQRLIRPFVLRRRKSQVLKELPPKTEIVLSVEMSPEERAFYEALRREAVSKIENEAGVANDKRFRILAELTKLRLACCHPKLVNPLTLLSSSKLELFGETVAELIENNHKVLVFSQFVMHLGIIQHYLKSKNIAYQYLDGSTPPTERQKRIDAFQAGEGDLFLISLKAGGTGLNLTAADYVIHLDPWWNPAVEDQASDRAHRIGQLRPVTVYRLVTEGTVEEKIVKLHEQKRDLADSLLNGTDAGGRMSAEDLLDLIKGG